MMFGQSPAWADAERKRSIVGKNSSLDIPFDVYLCSRSEPPEIVDESGERGQRLGIPT